MRATVTMRALTWGRKLVPVAVAALLALAAGSQAQQAADGRLPLTEAVSQIYLMLTGGSPPGQLSLRAQIDQATEMVYGPGWQGQVPSGLLARVQALVDVVRPGNPNASLLSRLMAVEWALNQGLYELSLLESGKPPVLPSLTAMPLRPITERVVWLETALYGKEQAGSLVRRVDALARDVWGGSGQVRIRVKPVTVSPGVGSVRVQLLGTISNERERLSRVGDRVPIVVLEDLRVEGALVIPRGMVGVVQVDEAEPPGPLGRPGKLSASGRVWAIDGTWLGVRLRLEASDSREAAAAGAAVGGAVAGGPLGVAAGLLVRGEARTLTQGSTAVAEIGPLPGLTGQPVPEAVLPP